MSLTRIKEILLCLLLVVAIVSVGNIAWNVRNVIRETNETMKEIRRGSKSLSDFAEYQTEQLQSDKTQKVLNANLELGAAAKGTVQAFNRLIIPRLMQNLDSSNAALIELRGTVRNGGDLISNTDKSLNQDLLPQAAALIHSLTATADRFGLTVETLDKSLQAIASKTNLSLDEIYSLLSDPHWRNTLANIDEGSLFFASTSRHVDATAAEIEKAMQNAPSIANSLERIARTSSRFTKITLIANIIGTLARAFLP